MRLNYLYGESAGMVRRPAETLFLPGFSGVLR
jgi:hypothetical protein